MDKIARQAEATGCVGTKVFCRILCDGAGAEWPLSRKFGCEPSMAAECGWSTPTVPASPPTASPFHVGSQQGNLDAWDGALSSAAAIFGELADRGIQLKMVNLGGGFPTR